METIILEVKAKHFKWTRFITNCNCTVAKAAKEQFKTKDVFEIPFELTVGKIAYTHEYYGGDEFYPDKDKAQSLNFDNTLIRTIVLTPQ